MRKKGIDNGNAYDVAMEYAQMGLPVFPCGDDKRPLTAAGFKAASTDEAQIRQWFGGRRHAVVGIPTGTYGDKCLIVIDCDKKDGIDGSESLATWLGRDVLPDTWTTLTAGNGTHQYFWLPAGKVLRNSASKLALKVDIRGEGGYVIAAGSATSDGRQWDLEASCPKKISDAPAWLADRLMAELSPHALPDRRQVASGGGEVAQGSRNDYLARFGGRMVRAGLSLEQAMAMVRAENERACDPPLLASELERTVFASAARWKFQADNAEAWQYGAGDAAELEHKKADALAEVPKFAELEISNVEMQQARIAPTCIVEDYLYADVGVLSAPGGTGKTTLCLHEDVNIALGRFVWGMPVRKPGWTLIITAEDQRELLVARLKRIMDAMQLTSAEYDKARAAIRVWDVTGEMRKLTVVHQGNIVMTALADLIVERFKDNPPVQVRFDPVVSFGASESMVNDNEQAIVECCRRICNGLGCCVRLVGHTGQEAARAKNTDQYTGRGGSALPDGCRMVHVLQAAHGDKFKALGAPPESLDVPLDAQVLVLARPKNSHGLPQTRAIWIVRHGYSYSYALDEDRSDPSVEVRADQIARFIQSECGQGRHYTINSLAELGADKTGMPRARVKQAVAELEVSGRLIRQKLNTPGRGGLSYRLVCAE